MVDRTVRLGLLGHPVGHSLSARMFEAAFRAAGIDGRYTPMDAPDDASFDRALDLLRTGALAGANVTLPHKRSALERAIDATADAHAVGASNLLVPDGRGGLRADNTDVGALADELLALGCGRGAALVLGAGGAARAAVVAARRIGFGVVWQRARRFHGSDAEAPPEHRLGWTADAEDPARVNGPPIDLVLQATSLGMRGVGGGELAVRAVPWASLDHAAVFYDLVYRPRDTPLVLAARARGLRAVSGLGMLVRQAEATYLRVIGAPPPDGVMSRAAEEALAADEAAPASC